MKLRHEKQTRLNELNPSQSQHKSKSQDHAINQRITYKENNTIKTQFEIPVCFNDSCSKH